MQGVVGGRAGQPAGEDGRRPVRRLGDRPCGPRRRGARSDGQRSSARLRHRRPDVRPRCARNGAGRAAGRQVRDQPDQARARRPRRSGQSRAVHLLRQGQHGDHLAVQRGRPGRQARVRRVHRVAGVAGAASRVPGRLQEPLHHADHLVHHVPQPQPGPDGDHQPDDLRRLAMDILASQEKLDVRRSPLAAVEEAEKLEREKGA